MYKVTLQLDRKQIIKMIKGLSIEDQAKLAQELNKTTWQKRFQNLIHRIDKRAKNQPRPSDEEIVQLVKQVRAEIRAKSISLP